jgi:hypothetical protein
MNQDYSDARDLRIAHGIHDQGPTPEQVAIIRRALEALDG